MSKTPPRLIMFLGLLLAVMLGFGQRPALAACAVQNGAVNVVSCGADASGRKDSTRAFADAIAAVPPGGSLNIPAGIFAVSATSDLNRPIHVTCAGTIRPFSAPKTGMSFFMIRSSKVHFDGKGCVFDGLSPANKHFMGAVMAASTGDFMDDVRVSGITIRNMGLGLTEYGYQGITMSGVKNCNVSNNRIENSGPTKSFDGGYAIYLQYTQDCVIAGNSGDHLGGTFINDSSSLRTRFDRNTVSYVTLFGYKGGYGTGFAVTDAGRPGRNAFTVSDSGQARAAFAPGKYINILAGGPITEGTVDYYVVGPGFLTIFMKGPMDNAPKVGDQIQPLSTAMRFTNNVCTQTGDNCYDINGWHDVVNDGAVCRYAGLYKPAGTAFGGLATCIWLGYDPTDKISTFRGQIARITGTDADHVGGSAIMVTEGVSNVIVENYRIANHNEKASPLGSSTCAITLNPLNINPNSRGSDLHIGRGTVASSAPGSCMAWIENSLNNTIIGMRGSAASGIVVDAGGQDLVRDNVVTANGTAPDTFAFLIGAGGGEHEHGVAFRNNRGTLTAAGWGGGKGYGFWNQSPANTDISVDGSNSVSAPNAPRGSFIPSAGIGR